MILYSMTGDWVTSKPLEALMGVLSSSFAIVSAAGFMFLMGIPFVSQVTVMPFLALAIGVDDTYVMLGAWQDTRRNLPPSKRMAQSLQEAGRYTNTVNEINRTNKSDCLKSWSDIVQGFKNKA